MQQQFENQFSWALNFEIDEMCNKPLPPFFCSEISAIGVFEFSARILDANGELVFLANIVFFNIQGANTIQTNRGI